MKKYNLINNLLGWACFLVAAVTYMLTLEPTASFWDCPEFISQGAKLEVGHPPGNPIFMLAARFFVTLFGNSMANAAIAVNTMSALLSAATILLLFWTITHLVRKLVVRDDETEISPLRMCLIFGAGICGALAYTWSDTFWFSAVEGEVYAFSSFCTALVFWLILKWENRADQPHSDRYLILIAYIIGVSIAVHLLNLLCIPAICLVFYYRKFKNADGKGSLMALGVSCLIVGAILYGLVPGFVKVAQQFELFCVNTLGMGYNMGVLTYAIILVGVFVWAIYSLWRQESPSAIKWSFFLAVILSGIPFIGSNGWIAVLLILALGVYLFGFCRKVPVRIFNVIVLSIFVIFVGYSSYALLLIRSTANTPMNQNSPDNVFALASYLNREQYGDRPLFYGTAFAEELVTEEYPEGSGVYYVLVDEQGYPMTRVLDGVLRDENGNPYSNTIKSYSKVVKTNPDEPDRYVDEASRPDYRNIPGMNMLFTRIYSTDEANGTVDGYKGWAEYETPDVYNIPAEVRAQWAQQGAAPMYEVAPYLTHTSELVTAMDGNDNPAKVVSAWKPGFGVNLRYFVNYQLNHMYWRYFMWNFAGRQNDLAGNGEPHLGNWISGIPFLDNARLGDQSLLPDEFGKGNKGHNVFYMLPLLLGIIGLVWQALYIHRSNPRRGIEQFWVVFFLFFMTGIAIVLYLNQTPGQPRERDYAFAGSFYAFAIWIGMGVPAVATYLQSLLHLSAGKKDKGEPDTLPAKADRLNPATVAIGCIIGLAVPLQMVSQTWDDHDRSGRYTARDFGMNYLASVDKDGILFCNGDNDTFPLWYAQEVEGFRTDVRVVNLSYLTTDWYANQIRHPAYDGKPVDMYAQPADYGYDRLAWSFVVPVTDTVVDAEKALRELYASDYKRFGGHLLTSPKVQIPVDSAAAWSRYGLDSNNGADQLYRIPYLDNINTDLSRLGSRGLSLSKTLSMDIIANSAKNGFERPVYFASTVPTSYYLGLSPYIASTGMTYEVTPFRNAPVSPNVEKAYENIMGNFRWGGLDAENASELYLDETVRRMVASTRSAMYSVVRDLIASGEQEASAFAIENAKANGKPVPVNRLDMARLLLQTISEKLPADVALFDGLLSVYMAQCYYDLYIHTANEADLDAATALIDAEIPRYAQLMRYASSLNSSRLSRLGSSELYALQYLGAALSLKNRIEVVRALAPKAVNDEATAELLARFAPRAPFDTEMRMAPLVYVQGFSADDLAAERERFTGSQRDVVDLALTVIEANKAAGIDPRAETLAVMNEYGLTPEVWNRLLRY